MSCPSKLTPRSPPRFGGRALIAIRSYQSIVELIVGRRRPLAAVQSAVCRGYYAAACPRGRLQCPPTVLSFCVHPSRADLQDLTANTCFFATFTCVYVKPPGVKSTFNYDVKQRETS